ncbi:ribosome small subunit-dependent GTPase A [Fictibacillus barbaricus]|uniref:Small ribosomal subunit biogenesis GTPase RsgA n=1 Tax=Fictibacillus barbaricus TaxID=182136 RepID=A0ABU1U4W9_9BACL|nr:ribosome small subunit-dependent GTPase A [Fictibacillus barbaricus]MDR7074519.1 ribosome biogenesis GTPase [Fictibacillus barbaricus]
MTEGRIVKALAGFYYVMDQDQIFQCRGRGNFRKRKVNPLVGDWVEYESSNKTDGYIMDVKERKNELVRPPIANVDQAILVFSAVQPDFSPLLLDRFLVHIEANDILPVICVSKMDLVEETSEYEKIQMYIEKYRDLGYEVIPTSTKTDDSLEMFYPLFKDKLTVFAGQSGVGKSSLLNAINPELMLETNEISSHLGRGKHTTRHVELILFGNGLVADTPGFSSLDFLNIEAEDLSKFFPEMNERRGDCKFRGCSHTSEPKCAIRAGVESGEIPDFRYEHYVSFLQEIKDQKRRY